MSQRISRRKFLALAGTGGVGLGLAACAPSAAPSAGTRTPAAPSALNADELDAQYEKAIKEFIAEADVHAGKFWIPRLKPRVEGDVKVFELACQEISWEIKRDTLIPALAYNGRVPGPEIRVTEGDKVRVIVRNELKESTAIHWHGVFTPNTMDGVPFISQPPIKSGQTFTYDFVAKPFGSHSYHSFHNAAEQIAKGLFAPFIVEPKDKKAEPSFDSDYTVVLNDARNGVMVNGKIFPGTAPIYAKQGERVRIRFMNGGWLSHPIHLHGNPMQIIAQDGWVLPAPPYRDTLDLAPGQRLDVIVECREPGAWAISQIPTNVESARGMFGMVMALMIK